MGTLILLYEHGVSASPDRITLTVAVTGESRLRPPVEEISQAAFSTDKERAVQWTVATISVAEQEFVFSPPKAAFSGSGGGTGLISTFSYSAFEFTFLPITKTRTHASRFTRIAIQLPSIPKDSS